MFYRYITFMLCYIFGLFSFADECSVLKETSKIQNKATKRVHTIFKGEKIKFAKNINKKLALVSVSSNEYRVYKKRLKSERVTCPQVVGNCLLANKNMRLRSSPQKKHTLVDIDQDQELFIATQVLRNKRIYYRLMVDGDTFVWVSNKQLKRSFASCSDGGDEGDLTEEEQQLEAEIMGDTSEVKEPLNLDLEPDDSKKFKPATYYSLLAGYGLGVSSEFLTPFVTSIANPSNVKNDPNPIIQSTENGSGISVGLYYKRKIFSEKYMLRLGLGYEQNSFLLTGKSNPATASSIVRLDDLAAYELQVDLSIVNIVSGLSYKVYGHNKFKLMLGLDLGIDYNLNDEIIIARRIGATKTTEDESKLTLELVKGVAAPNIELWFNFGLIMGAKYKYVFGSSGYLQAYLGYSI